MDSSNKPGNRDEGHERSNVIDAADLFRRPRLTPPLPFHGVSTPSSSRAVAPSKEDKYPNLHRNRGLMDRVCRVYSQHVGQMRNGARVATTLMLRNDDPLVVRREVREFIRELDKDDGLVFSFSDTLSVEGGTWRSYNEAPTPTKQVSSDELIRITARLQREMDINFALREESDDDDEAVVTLYRMRKGDSERVVENEVMGEVVNGEKTFVMRMITLLNASKTRGGSKSLMHYVSNILSIRISTSRNT